MKILDKITSKIDEFHRRNPLSRQPKRLMLGIEDLEEVKSEHHLNNILSTDSWKNLILMGLKVSLSNRKRYVRVMPEKMNYLKKNTYSYYKYNDFEKVYISDSGLSAWDYYSVKKL